MFRGVKPFSQEKITEKCGFNAVKVDRQWFPQSKFFLKWLVTAYYTAMKFFMSLLSVRV